MIAHARRIEFERHYVPLRDDASWAHEKWQIWLQLFSTSQGRVDLLNRAALSFFFTMRLVFVREAVISLSRLITDAPGEHKTAISRSNDSSAFSMSRARLRFAQNYRHAWRARVPH